MRILFLENSVKRHSCSAKNSRLVHDLHTSVIHGGILPFSEDFIFTKRSFAKIKPSQKFPIYSKWLEPLQMGLDNKVLKVI